MKQLHDDARSLAEHLGSEIEMVEHEDGTVSVGEWRLGLLDHDDGAIVWAERGAPWPGHMDLVRTAAREERAAGCTCDLPVVVLPPPAKVMHRQQCFLAIVRTSLADLASQ